MKADRLLSVLMLLQAKGRATERELAEQLEVSQRTIHRDLEALSAARVPVVALRGSQGGWELEKGWRTQVPALDESELRALLMAQPRAAGHPRLAAAAQSAPSWETGPLRTCSESLAPRKPRPGESSEMASRTLVLPAPLGPASTTGAASVINSPTA